MNKKELISKVAEKTQQSEKSVKACMECILDEIALSLQNREEVNLWGFGKFEARSFKKRNCYNPISGKIETIKPNYTPCFKAGTLLKKLVGTK